MPLILGTEIITDPSAANLIDKLLALPLITVVQQDDRTTNANTVLCLEQEILCGNKDKLENSGIAFLGTKNVSQCIALYLTTDQDCVLIHCNGRDTLYAGLSQLFAQLTSKNNIRIKLAGGEVDTAEAISSLRLLQSIVSALGQLATEQSCDITIEAQYLLHHNRPNPASIRRYVFNRVLKIVATAYKKIYGTALDFNRLGALTEAACNASYQEVGTEGIIGFWEIIAACGGSVVGECEIEQTLMPLVREMAGNEAILQMMRAFFCTQAIDQITQKTFPNCSRSANQLEHFAFSIRSGQIVSIRPTLSLLHETYRHAFVCAHHTSYTLQTPDNLALSPLGPVFLAHCATIETAVQQGLVANITSFKQSTQTLFGLPEAVIELIYTFIQSEDYQLAKLLAAHSAVALHQQAVTFFKAQDFLSAAVCAEQAVAAFPADSQDQAASYGVLARCYEKLKRTEEAITAAKACLRITEQLFSNSDARTTKAKQRVEELEKLLPPEQSSNSLEATAGTNTSITEANSEAQANVDENDAFISGPWPPCAIM